jgi:hypothetical protein
MCSGHGAILSQIVTASVEIELNSLRNFIYLGKVFLLELALIHRGNVLLLVS